MDVKENMAFFMTLGNIFINKRKKSGNQNKMMPQYISHSPRPNFKKKMIFTLMCSVL